MDPLTTFDSTKESLFDLLRSSREGKTQLPDFQRGWVWDDAHIRSLLASVSMSYPVGAVMMLQTGNPNVRFKPRLVEGVSIDPAPAPERLILDGQQRLTSLYQALLSGRPVDTRDVRGDPIRRWYYIDVRKAIDPSADREDAILAIPADRCQRNFRGEVVLDLTSREKECEAELFPLPLVFDIAGVTTWQMAYIGTDPTKIGERLARWNEFVSNVIHPFQQYQVPLIVMRKETKKDAVCLVFERVNTGGVPLNVFELLTAMYAADDFNLRDDWSTRRDALASFRALAQMENTDFLQVVSLLATRERRITALKRGVKEDEAPGISCKRKEILRLSLDDYRTWSSAATEGFARAAKFLYAQNLYSADDLPYRTQLVPLAATLAALGPRSESDAVRSLLGRWFWCGVFGELYGSAIEGRFAKDLPEMLAWVDGGPEPSAIQEASFAASRLRRLRTRNSAAYKGLYALLLRDGGVDFRTGARIDEQTYFDEAVDIHHIFPQKWCAENEVERDLCDSVVNKTAISARTNRMIGGHAPSTYLPRMEKSAGIAAERLDAILRTHVIDPSAIRSDDFHTFYATRETALLDRVERSMGKPVVRDIVSVGATTSADSRLASASGKSPAEQARDERRLQRMQERISELRAELQQLHLSESETRPPEATSP